MDLLAPVVGIIRMTAPPPSSSSSHRRALNQVLEQYLSIRPTKRNKTQSSSPIDRPTARPSVRSVPRAHSHFSPSRAGLGVARVIFAALLLSRFAGRWVGGEIGEHRRSSGIIGTEHRRRRRWRCRSAQRGKKTQASVATARYPTNHTLLNWFLFVVSLLFWLA